jgi:hypothetical protein
MIALVALTELELDTEESAVGPDATIKTSPLEAMI